MKSVGGVVGYKVRAWCWLVIHEEVVSLVRHNVGGGVVNVFEGRVTGQDVFA